MGEWAAQVWNVQSPTRGAKAIARGQAFMLSVGTTVQFGAVSAVVEAETALQPAPSAPVRCDPGAVAGLKKCCDVCGRPLALSAWITGQRTCDPCAEYGSELQTCLQSGAVSQQAISGLQPRANQLGLLPEDRLRLHERAFRDLCEAAGGRHSFSPTDIQRLETLAAWLQLPANIVSSCLAHLRRVSQLHYGPLPAISNCPLQLLRGEVCHWMENQSQYIEEQTHTRRQGSYSGYSMRVCKGLTYRVGGFSGYSYPVAASVPVDAGCFIITSARVAFVGAHRSFAIPFRKILSMQVFTNGIQLQADGARARPQMFTLGDVDAACVVLTRAMNAVL